VCGCVWLCVVGGERERAVARQIFLLVLCTTVNFLTNNDAKLLPNQFVCQITQVYNEWQQFGRGPH
jgi:hypothetical protein